VSETVGVIETVLGCCHRFQHALLSTGDAGSERRNLFSDKEYEESMTDQERLHEAVIEDLAGCWNWAACKRVLRGKRY
jgi:hypothetical protein